MEEIKGIEIKHKSEEKFLMRIKLDYNIAYHIKRHIIKNKYEFWNEWINQDNLDKAEVEIDQLSCQIKNSNEIEPPPCKDCVEFQKCIEIIEKYELIKGYINVQFNVLENDLKDGPRHTHHLNIKENRVEMYYLGNNGVLIVNVQQKNKSFLIITGYRFTERTFGSLYINMLRDNVQLRHETFINKAQKYIREKAKAKKIIVNAWCTKENWGIKNEETY